MENLTHYYWHVGSVREVTLIGLCTKRCHSSPVLNYIALLGAGLHTSLLGLTVARKYQSIGKQFHYPFVTFRPLFLPQLLLLKVPVFANSINHLFRDHKEQVQQTLQ